MPPQPVMLPLLEPATPPTKPYLALTLVRPPAVPSRQFSSVPVFCPAMPPTWLAETSICSGL